MVTHHISDFSHIEKRPFKTRGEIAFGKIKNEVSGDNDDEDDAQCRYEIIPKITQ